MPILQAKDFTSFAVAPDGETISLNFDDDLDRCCTVVIRVAHVKELMMTLPEMMRQSLARKYKDGSLRLVYPVAAWELEAATQPGSLILTFRTPDRFEVAFGLPRAELDRMAATAGRADSDGLLRGLAGN